MAVTKSDTCTFVSMDCAVSNKLSIALIAYGAGVILGWPSALNLYSLEHMPLGIIT